MFDGKKVVPIYTSITFSAAYIPFVHFTEGVGTPQEEKDFSHYMNRGPPLCHSSCARMSELAGSCFLQSKCFTLTTYSNGKKSQLLNSLRIRDLLFKSNMLTSTTHSQNFKYMALPEHS